MRVKASYGVGLKSAQAWGGPCSIKCQFKDIRSALISSLPLLSTGVNIENRFWKLANRYKYTRDILHSTLCNGGATADYRTDYEIR